MKDLYKNLNLSQHASLVEIREALSRNASLNKDDREDVKWVLLDPVRRRAYDRAYRMLKLIGMARAATGTHDTGFWRGKEYQSFKPVPSRTSTHHSSPASSGAGPKQGWQVGIGYGRRPWKDRLIGLGALGSILFVVFLGLNIDNGTRISPPQPDSKNWSGLQVASSTNHSKYQQPATVIDLSSRDDGALSTREVCALQEMLSNTGHYKSAVDGLAGAGTLTAVSDFLREIDAVSDKPLTKGTLKLIKARYQRNPNKSSHWLGNNPNSGNVLLGNSAYRGAPFKVKVPAGSEDYFVKLVSLSTSEDVIGFYVRHGEIVTVNVPLGRYELRYAVGTHWFGTRCLFGMTTRVSRADDPMVFVRDGNRLQGQYVELIKQVSGNLETYSMATDSF